MGKNPKKQLADIIFILVLVALIILGNIIKQTNKIFTIVYIILALVTFIADSIFNIVEWRCPNCKEHLPNKLFYKNIECCPYCKTKID